MTARIAPVQPPFPSDIQQRFDRIMPEGVPPLTLFTTLARDARFARFSGGSLLGPGNLTLRQREIVIDRITALSGSEYEWGVHVAFFGEAAGLTQAQIRSLTQGGVDDPVWIDEERALLRACDQLHSDCDIDDAGWQALQAHFLRDGNP